jgi:hypothetical protein
MLETGNSVPMKPVSIFDRNFSVSKSEGYELSIQLSLDGFSFLIKDAASSKFYGLRHLPYPDGIHPDDLSKELHKQLDLEPVAGLKYASVKVVYWTPKATLIPEPLFDTGKLKAYFELNIKLSDNEAIYYHKIKNMPAYMAYAVPADISTVCGNYFPGAKFYCQAQPILEAALSDRSSLGKTPSIYLSVCKNFFDIQLFDKGALVMHSCFNYSYSADFVYFVLNIFEQFKLNPETTPVYFSGFADKLSEEYIALSKYIGGLGTIDFSGKGLFTNAVPEKELHRYAAPIYLSMCE